MKSIFTALFLTAFGVGIIGCSASADVDPNHDHSSSNTSGGSYEKKTVTTEHPNGTVDKSVETHSSNP